MIIDTHLHIWDLARFHYAWISPDSAVLHRTYLPADIWPHFQACGVGGAVFVQANDLIEESEWVLGLSERYPWLLGVVGWIDLAAPDIQRTLDRLCAHPRFKGVRAGAPGTDWLLGDAVQPSLRALAKRGLSLDVLTGPAELALLPALAAQHPDLTIVLDHLGGPPTASGDLTEWRRLLGAAAAAPNIVAKVSGLLTQAQRPDRSLADIGAVVQTALDSFGPQRLMFGGDWPVSLLAAPYPAMFDSTRLALSGLSQEDAAHIWQATATRVYRLAGEST